MQLVGRNTDLAVLEGLASGITARGEAIELRGQPGVGDGRRTPGR
jgi:hypothetical protein